MLGWSESIYNHITLRCRAKSVPDQSVGLRVVGSDRQQLVKTTATATSCAEAHIRFNLAGFTQHSGFTVGCRGPTPSSTPTRRNHGGLLERGRADADQLLFVLFDGAIGYHDFEGITGGPRRRAAGPNVGNNRC